MLSWLRRKPRPERTIVHLRTRGMTPAKFFEAEVHYDAWGTPYVNCDAYHGNQSWMANTLQPAGRAGRDLEWKHKSGPLVTFPDGRAPDRGWFPNV